MPSTTMPGHGPGRGSSESTALAPAPLAAARSLRDAIEASAGWAEEHAQLDPAVVEQVSQRGLFGLMVPEVLGGFEADPVPSSTLSPSCPMPTAPTDGP